MENGAKSPGLEAAYQLHWSVTVTNARTGASRTLKK